MFFHLGLSGSGKSEIALQVLKRLKNEETVSGIFNSVSDQSLMSSLKTFSKKHGLIAKEKLDADENVTMEDRLKEISSSLKKPEFKERQKILIFDDMEIARLLYIIDTTICHQLPQDGMTRRKWLVLVTTQEWKQDLHYGCDIVNGKTDVVDVAGFSTSEFHEFLSRGSRTSSLSENEKQLIKNKIGTLPIFLKVLRADIENHQVGT